MGLWIRKLLSDEGELFIAYQSTSSVFVTPAYTDIEELISYAKAEGIISEGEDRMEEFFREQAQNYSNMVFDITTASVRKYVGYIIRLNEGQSVTEEQAAQLYVFMEYLSALIDIPQGRFEQFRGDALLTVIEKLDLFKLYKESYLTYDILDNVKWNAISRHWFKLSNKGREDWDSEDMTPEQNKLIGWYLFTACKIAKLVGKDRMSPLDSLKRFQD